MEEKIITTINNLKINGYEVDYFESSVDAKKALLEAISREESKSSYSRVAL